MRHNAAVRHCSLVSPSSPPAAVCTAALALLAAVPAAADEIRLRSGDRFTGRVVSLDQGTLAFDTPYGRVSVPWTEVVGLRVDEAIAVTVGTAAPAVATIAAAADGQVQLQPGPAVLLADIVSLARPPLLTLTLDGGANAGFVTTGGNTDVYSLRTDGTITLRRNQHRYAATAVLNQTEDRGELTAQNWTTSLNYDRFVSRRVFVNANGILTSDRFRDLDLRTALGLGVGLQVRDTPRLRFTTNAGFGWVHQNFASAPNEHYTAARESTVFEYFLVPRRVQLFHNHDGYFGLNGDDNLFLKTQNGLRLSIVASLVTTLQLDLDYDHSPAPGRRQTDRTFALTFGYRF